MQAKAGNPSLSFAKPQNETRKNLTEKMSEDSVEAFNQPRKSLKQLKKPRSSLKARRVTR
jgi:hypothetical protein